MNILYAVLDYVNDIYIYNFNGKACCMELVKIRMKMFTDEIKISFYNIIG